MKNLNRLGFILSVGTMAALSFSLAACSDDPETGGGTAGVGTSGATTTAGTGGAGTAGAGTSGSTSTAGTGGAGTSGSGTGGSTAGSGGSTAGGGGSTAGGGGSTAGGSGGAGGGGGAGPMCPNIEGASNDPATCMSYCMDAVAACGAHADTTMMIKDAATCATFCSSFTEAQLCCRAHHADMAGTDMASMNMHCKHTVGVEACQ